MKFKKAKYITELRECRKAFQELNDALCAYDIKCDEYADETNIGTLPLWDYPLANDCMATILFKIVYQEFQLPVEQYKEICYDCLRIIFEYDEERIERAYIDHFWYDEWDTPPYCFSFFEDNLHSELKNAVSEPWKFLIINSILFNEPKVESLCYINTYICKVYIAMGNYLSKKLDDKAFEYAMLYHLSRMKIRITQYIEEINTLIVSNDTKEWMVALGLDEFVQHWKS